MNNLMRKIGLIAIKMRFLAIGPIFGLIVLLPNNALAQSSEKILMGNLAFAKNIIENVNFGKKSMDSSRNMVKIAVISENQVKTDLGDLHRFASVSKAPECIGVVGKRSEDEKPHKIVKAVITAYTSTPDQTDDTPFIGASGKHVYDGMIAANWLPFGTKVKIPALYGDKVFTVDDRMNSRYGYGRMDIWLDTTKAEAMKFGVKRVEVQIFYENKPVQKLVIAK